MLGSRQEIAQRWAKNFHFPMALPRRPLPQVAQYLSVNQSYEFPRDELATYLRHGLVENYGEQLPPEYYRDRKIESLPLNKLMSDVWRIRYPEGRWTPTPCWPRCRSRCT